MAIPAAIPYTEAYPALVHDAFYLVHGSTDESDSLCWRVAWWDANDNEFYDTEGDCIEKVNLKVVPEPLPTVG